MDIKIAFINSVFPGGGVETLTSDLSAWLTVRGYRVYMFVENLNRSQLRPADKDNISFIATDYSGRGGRIKAARFVAGEVNRLGIDIIVSPVGYVDLPTLRRHTDAKIVFSLHSLPLWEILNFFPSSHHYALHSDVGKFLEWFMLRYPHELITGKRVRRLKKRNIDHYLNSDLYTVLSEEYKQQFIEFLGPDTATAENNHIEAIPNWIPPKEYGAMEKKQRVLFMGRLSYGDKRIDRLIDIWSMVERDFPGWELWIVGEGREKKSLMRRAKRLKLGNVEFRDYTKDPGEYYREASILCLTSNYEGWPMVIAEAQQAGVVPIAFDVAAGIREQIAPSGMNGVLVPPFDKAEYARELARLMGDDELRERMSRNVVAKAREYSDESRLAKWDAEFRKLLGRE
jgi:glycosyltransferase involved in cell wall biosynthesis